MTCSVSTKLAVQPCRLTELSEKQREVEESERHCLCVGTPAPEPASGPLNAAPGDDDYASEHVLRAVAPVKLRQMLDGAHDQPGDKTIQSSLCQSFAEGGRR